MSELQAFCTPQNFAMLIALILLLRVEKAIGMMKSCVDRNTKVLMILVMRASGMSISDNGKKQNSEKGRDKELDTMISDLCRNDEEVTNVQ